MKKFILASILTLPLLGLGQAAMGEVIGTVILKKDNSTAYNARIETESNGTIYRAKTDPDGRFRISAIPAGEYLFTIYYNGDTLSNVEAKVPMDGIANLGTIKFESKILVLGDVVINGGEKPIKLTYGVVPEIKMDRDQIAHSPSRFDQKGMIAAMSSEIQKTDDGELVFRGARKGDMIYMMDGIKMTSVVNVPSAAIGGLMVYTGGIPAKYGDTMGGVVVMESLSYFDLYRAWKAKEMKKEANDPF